MRLLGTSPAPSSRFPRPPPFFPCLSSCPPVFLGHFFVLSLAPDRPAADRSKVISPWFVLDGSTTVPALAPFSSWPRGLVRECCLLVDPGLLHHCHAPLPNGHPNTWPFSRLRLAAVVREYGLPWVDLLDLLCLPPPMQLTSGAKAFNNHSPFPLVRPVFSAGERIMGHESRFHPLLLEYFGV